MNQAVSILIIAFFTLINNVLAQNWSQRGDTIQSRETAINSDGTIVGMTGFNSDYYPTFTVKEWDGNLWTQKGSEVTFQDQDNLGEVLNIDMSSDGNTVAVLVNGSYPYGYTFPGPNPTGHILFYDWNGTIWGKRSDSIIPDQSGGVRNLSQFKMSGNGENCIISGNNHARVYAWNGNSWVQKGSLFQGDFEDHLGYALDISENGNTVIISSPQTDPVGNITEHHGKTRIYEWNLNSWDQKGVTILGETIVDYSGADVGISNDGNTVIIGAPVNDDAGNNAGHARVFSWSGSSWSQVGNDIDGEYAEDRSGNSVDINADGNVVAIGSMKNPDGGVVAGHVRIYYWNGSIWYQKGNDLDGNESDEFGRFVQLSDDGNALLAATNLNNQAYSRVLYFCQDPQAVISQYDSVTLSTSYTNADSYQWMNCETGLEITGENSPTLTITSEGSYSVDIFEGGCVYSTDCFEVDSIAVSLSKETKTEPLLYPNPNNGSFTLQLPENSVFKEVVILSMDGKVVYRNQVPNQESIQYELDLEKGVYVLKLTNFEQQTQKMFVVN